MEHTFDPRHPVQELFGRLKPTNGWALGPVLEGEGSVVGSEGLRRSDWAECECPGDCLRDHENE